MVIQLPVYDTAIYRDFSTNTETRETDMNVRRIINKCISIAIVTITLVSSSFFEVQAATPYTTTVTNFDSAGRQVTRFDTNGNAIDAHDGDLAYFNGKYYLYGTSYDCGYRLQVVGTPFCGFKAYSSTDLVHWTDQGFLYDATTVARQASCAPPRYGCYRPHVLYNNSTQKYVLWINGYDNASGYHVFAANTPTGPFIEQPEPQLAVMGTPGTFVNGDMDIFKDTDGTAYIAYTNIPSSHSIKIQRLNADYTSGVGAATTAVGSGVEAPSLFKRSGTYYLVFGPTCPYCGGTSTQYKTATTPLGPWGAAAQINPTSCGGQPSFVSQLPGTSGDIYVYGSDLWNAGNPNQALANYFWNTLSFSGAAINAVPCSNTFTTTLGDGARGVIPIIASADQSSGSSFFRTHCDIRSGWSRMQTFTPSRTGVLGKVAITTFKNNANGALKIDIVPVNGSAVPTGAPLYSGSIPASSIGWSPREIVISPNVQVTAGVSYGIVQRSPDTNNGGCYGILYSDYRPYQRGIAAYLPAANGTWTVESGRSLKFRTALGLTWR